jgi:hypothetical protein
MSYKKGRAIAQVVSRRPLTAEARVRAPVNPCGICGGQSGTGTGFSPSSTIFPCQYISFQGPSGSEAKLHERYYSLSFRNINLAF